MPNLFLFVGFRIPDLIKTDIANHTSFIIKWNRWEILISTITKQSGTSNRKIRLQQSWEKEKPAIFHFIGLHDCDFDTVCASSYKRVCTSLMPQSDAHVGNTWAELRHHVPNRFLLFADVPLLDFTVPKQTSKTLHTTTLQCQHTNQNTQEFLSNVFSSGSCKITMMKTTTSSSVRTARAPAQMINGSPATSRHRISLVITALLL